MANSGTPPSRRQVSAAGILVLVAALLGCGSKGTATGAALSDGVLHIGASLSLTGRLAREGRLTGQGYQLCEQVVNAAGGVAIGDHGRARLNIEMQDDTSRPDAAAQIVDRFNDQGYRLILGPYGSAATAAAAAVIERNGQVMVDSLGADDRIFDDGYRRTFAVLSPASEYAATIVRALHELVPAHVDTVAFLSADDGFSTSATDGGVRAARAAGFDVVATEFFPHGSSNVSTVLTRIRPLDPDVIIGSAHFAEGVAVIKQSAELGIRPKVLAETIAPATPDFTQTLGRLAEGVLGASQWVPTVRGKDDWFGTARDYARLYKQTFGETPNYHAATAAAACLALVLAVERAGTADADQVRDALASLKVDTFFGPIAFDETGKNTTKPMAVIQIQNGRPVTVWPSDLAEGTLVLPGTVP